MEIMVIIRLNDLDQLTTRVSHLPFPMLYNSPALLGPRGSVHFALKSGNNTSRSKFIFLILSKQNIKNMNTLISVFIFQLCQETAYYCSVFSTKETIV